MMWLSSKSMTVFFNRRSSIEFVRLPEPMRRACSKETGWRALRQVDSLTEGFRAFSQIRRDTRVNSKHANANITGQYSGSGVPVKLAPNT